MRRKRFVVVAAAVIVSSAAIGAEPVKGPSSSQPAYVTPTASGWTATSLITTGDGADQNGYRMVGNPDGLGVIGGAWSSTLRKYTQPDQYLTVFMNYELPLGAGIPRAHGQAGAFVSQWTIELGSLRVVRGEDLIQRVMTWNGTTRSFQETTGQTAFDRFCSGDLPKPTAFRDPVSGKGYAGRLYLNGEEAGFNGRAFAHVISGAQKGTTYELPYLGKSAWENVLAHPAAGLQTVVVALNDASPGQVYVYVGTKQATGNPVERAGLQGGKLYGVKVTNGGPNYNGSAVLVEDAGSINGRFTLVDVSAGALASGTVLETKSDDAHVTQFARPEDGHWDPSDPHVFYFVVTGTLDQTARLYRLRFDSTTWPVGGSIELVVDSHDLTGTDGRVAQFFDNVTVSANGTVLVQEDPGSDAYLSKVWKIKPSSPPVALQVMKANPAFFLSGGTSFHTQTEENTGIVDVTSFVRPAAWYQSTRRYYLGNMMDHSISPDPELYRGGQLYLISGPK
jgi:hypothetical protein